MDIIFNERGINLNLHVKTGICQRDEDFSRSDVVAFLEGPREKYGFKLTEQEKTKDGKLYLHVPAGTIDAQHTGLYSLRVVWFKTRGGGMQKDVPAFEYGRLMQTCTLSRVFGVTADVDDDNTGFNPDDPTPYVKSYNVKAEPFGRDGMSAYEIAVLHGSQVRSESEWIARYENAEERCALLADRMEAELARLEELKGVLEEASVIIDEFATGYMWSVNPRYVSGGGEQTITLSAACIGDKEFDAVAFYVGDSEEAIASDVNTKTLQATYAVSTTTTFRCEATIDGDAHVSTKTVEYPPVIYIGAGSSKNDVIDSEHAHYLDEHLRGSFDVVVSSTPNKGHIIIAIEEARQGAFIRAEMGGVEMGFNISNHVEYNGTYYKLFISQEEFLPDTYNIDIN